MAAGHAITRTLPAASLEWIVLATDGAADTARHQIDEKIAGQIGEKS
jgi:hypothetical protein